MKIQKSEIHSAIITTLICGIILLILLFFGITRIKEYPPPPDGVEIEFGDMLFGNGADGSPAPTEGLPPSEPEVSEPVPVEPTPTAAPNLIAQEDPSVVLEREEKKRQEKVKQEQARQEKIRQQQEQAAKEKAAAEAKARQEKANQINSQMGGLFGGGSGGGGNTVGTAPGGGGTGNTPGNPLGKGSGLVGGTGWSLKGRDWKGGGMKPSYVGSQTGVIIVSIRVDKNGNVITANIKQKGTTISDADQREECIRTAKQAKFSAANQGTEDALGEITYRFNQN